VAGDLQPHAGVLARGAVRHLDRDAEAETKLDALDAQADRADAVDAGAARGVGRRGRRLVVAVADAGDVHAIVRLRRCAATAPALATLAALAADADARAASRGRVRDRLSALATDADAGGGIVVEVLVEVLDAHGRLDVVMDLRRAVVIGRAASVGLASGECRSGSDSDERRKDNDFHVSDSFR
jgi:hypothetical protein